MACLQTWILAFCFTLTQCAPLIYNGKPLVLHETHPNIHLYLEDDPSNIILTEFPASRPPNLYPLAPLEWDELYLRLSKQPNKFSKYLKYTSGGKLKPQWKVEDSETCCGNEWVDYQAFGRPQYNELTKPVFQLGFGYPSNQIQEYRNSDVKPVMEHIEGDLKYDFRTNTHSI